MVRPRTNRPRYLYSTVFDLPFFHALAIILCLAALGASQVASAAKVYKFKDADGVVTYTDKVVRGAQVIEFKDRMVEKLDNRIRLQRLKHESGEVLLVKNDLYAPVEVELRLQAVENADSVPDKPVRAVVPPRSQSRLLTLKPRIPGQPLRYKTKLAHVLGDPAAKAVPYRYPLPWRGGPFRLTQGPNGKYSHNTPKGRYAMDIAMPEGTPIIAARAGVVVSLDNKQNGRGTHPSGNFVRILHDDSTMSVYLHLKRGSITVKEGQKVTQGTLLARSGNTGNSTGPHLHFVVQRNVGFALQSIPFEFNQAVNSLPNFAGKKP